MATRTITKANTLEVQKLFIEVSKSNPKDLDAILELVDGFAGAAFSHDANSGLDDEVPEGSPPMVCVVVETVQVEDFLEELNDLEINS